MDQRRYIVVEGPIGAGKTALATLLAERLGGKAVLEAPEENPFLPLFYEDPNKHAFQTQLFFLLTRFQQQKELLQQDLFAQVTVSDCLFEKDRVFAALSLNPAEQALYARVYEELHPQVTRPDLVIYLQARLDVLLQRIRRTGRPFERDIDPDYLARLASMYSDYFFHYDGAPLLVIDGSELDLSSPEDQETIVNLVKRHRGGVQHYIPRRSHL